MLPRDPINNLQTACKQDSQRKGIAISVCFCVKAHKINVLGPVVRSMVSANHRLSSTKINRFPNDGI